MKATHGSVPMTGIWPRAPRRFWHVGPMARSVRDIALAFSQLSGPDGHDAFPAMRRFTQMDCRLHHYVRFVLAG